jgi:hypothetical protein
VSKKIFSVTIVRGIEEKEEICQKDFFDAPTSIQATK